MIAIETAIKLAARKGEGRKFVSWVGSAQVPDDWKHCGEDYWKSPAGFVACGPSLGNPDRLYVLHMQGIE